jgi:hypothetical protein
MANREKVIKGLQCCKSPNDHEHCPYNIGVHYNVCVYRLLSDAVELLKEQEPVAPRKVKRYIEYSDTAINFIDTYDCGNCGAELPDNSKYCSVCGRKVKWDE